MPETLEATLRTRERRAFSTQFEMRQNGDKIGFRGYAAIFDSPANGEVVRRSAFNKTLAERDNVRLLVNHEGIPLASTKATTMTLGVDDRGLFVEVDELDTTNPTVQELVSAMTRGDISEMSFAFIDMTPREDRIGKDGNRQLLDVRLYDVSVVTFPWYEDTMAELNSLALAEVRAHKTTEKIRAAYRQAGLLAPITDSRDLAGWTLTDLRPLLFDAVEDAMEDENYWWLGICDVSDTWFVYIVEGMDDCDCFQVDYTVDEAGAITLGMPRLVIAKTTYLPDPDAAEDIAAGDPGTVETNSAPMWRLEAARALLNRNTAA